MITSTEIRAWANESENFEGFVGKRGRLGPVIKSAYFSANPKVAREVASEAGIEVPARGRLSDEVIHTIAGLLP